MTNSAKELRTMAAYGVVGFINTIICLLLMWLGDQAGLNYVIYTAIGYGVTIILSFFMNLRYTFKVADAVQKRLFLFIAVSLFNFLLVEIIQYGLIEGVDVSKPIAAILSMGWYVFFGYFMNKWWVYAPSSTA